MLVRISSDQLPVATRAKHLLVPGSRDFVVVEIGTYDERPLVEYFLNVDQVRPMAALFRTLVDELDAIAARVDPEADDAPADARAEKAEAGTLTPVTAEAF